MSIIYSGERLRQLIDNSAHGNLQLGAISTIRKLQINRRKTQRQYNHKKARKPTKQTGINRSNLHKIELMANENKEHIKTICTATINMHSVKNKDLLLSKQFHHLGIDMAVLIETWLKDTPQDIAWLHQSGLMHNYTVRTHNRPGQKK